MRILLIHNRYTIPGGGGEEVVVASERALLEAHGHEVLLFERSNDELPERGVLARGKLAAEALWSVASARDVAERARAFRPDIAHVHNTFTKLSPSIYWSLGRIGIPVVQTLHNYRLICANGLLLRDARPCRACLDAPLPTPALRYRCYRDSLAATGVVASLQTLHRALGTYRRHIDAFIALTPFARRLMIEAGFAADRLHVKPNAVPDPLEGGVPDAERRDQVVFVGRIAPEKGVDTLLAAWRRLAPPTTELILVGDGPEAPALRRSSDDLPGVVWRGRMPHADALREIARSRFLVMSSPWYEVFPMVLLEGMSLGTPLIAPDHGGIPDIVTEALGRRVPPSDPDALAATLAKALTAPADRWRAWSRHARTTYLERYTPEANYRRLMEIYGLVLGTPTAS